MATTDDIIRGELATRDSLPPILLTAIVYTGTSECRDDLFPEHFSLGEESSFSTGADAVLVFTAELGGYYPELDKPIVFGRARTPLS